jgi:hypothetical protein
MLRRRFSRSPGCPRGFLFSGGKRRGERHSFSQFTPCRPGHGERWAPHTVEIPGEPVEVPAVDVSGRISFELASLNYEFAMVDTPRFQWGLGAGITHATLAARGTATSAGTGEIDPQWEDLDWKRDGTSPNLHTRVAWSPTPRLRIEAQGQYLDTRWGNFINEQGHFERGGLLVEYRVTERIGVHVGYDWFRLKLSDDYRGSFEAPAESGIGTVDVAGKATGEFKVHGPMAGVSVRF